MMLIPAVNNGTKLIRDAKDQPILNTAIVSDVDIISVNKNLIRVKTEDVLCSQKDAQIGIIYRRRAFTKLIIANYAWCLHSLRGIL